MIKFCVRHNAISYDGVKWHYPAESFDNLLRARQEPAQLCECPHCNDIAERIHRLLKKSYITINRR